MISMRAATLWMITLALLSACDRQPPQPAQPLDETALAVKIAEDFVDGYYRQFPEEAAESGYQQAPDDRFSTQSPTALNDWYLQIDNWISALQGIDADSLRGTTAEIPYRFALSRLQALRGMRVCQSATWNVNPTWTGWQSRAVDVFSVQPVDSEVQRAAALRRLEDLVRVVKDQRGLLLEGMRNDYRAANSNVQAVILQMDALIALPIEESPYYSPALRSGDAAFAEQWRSIYDKRLLPALRDYRKFLAEDYVGREAVGVAANPRGRECYENAIRYWSTLGMSPEDIHRKGLSEMARIQGEMLQIAQRSFGTSDVSGLLSQLRSDERYTFGSEAEMLDYVRDAVERAARQMDAFFGFLPDVALQIVPSPAYEKDSGGGYYSAGSSDGSQPSIYRVGTYNPRGISKAGVEATAFHESYPGHHLQNIVALNSPGLHPVQRYVYVSGYSEGWGLYAERLADEIGLYSSDLDRLGMLSNEAYRAARLVIDPGLHVMGWSRDDAIQYMMEHTTEGIDAASGEIDRYIAVPGQATSYLLGSLEIQRLRARAQTALGAEFDIREFHDRILTHGQVSLPMLRDSINAWIAERQVSSD